MNISESQGFGFTRADFYCIRELIHEVTGIVLSSERLDMVYHRLLPRLIANDVDSFEDYCGVLKSAEGGELQEAVNALTTNLTSFFREPHHFDFLEDKVCPEILQVNRADERIRIWSAGCSTGEEAYSIAMVLSGLLELSPYHHDIKILATDVDSTVLEKASAGCYDAQSAEGIPIELKRKNFLKRETELGTQVRVKDKIRRLVSFKPLNLIQPWPMNGPFEAIFCRNVLIYFDDETRLDLIRRFCGLLRPGGYLFLGHSETLGAPIPGLTTVGHTIFQKSLPSKYLSMTGTIDLFTQE